MIDIPRLKEAIRPFAEKRTNISLNEVLELGFLTSLVIERPASKEQMHRLGDFFMENIHNSQNPKIYLIENFIDSCLSKIYKHYNVLTISQPSILGTTLIDILITKN